MDTADQRLVQALRRNGRATVSNLAVELGISRATVRTRLEKLVAQGEILGFTVVLKSDVDDLPVRGIMLITVQGRGTDRIIGQLSGMPEVQTVHTTNGRWDLIVELGTQSLADLDAVLRRIRLIDGIANSETNLYLSTKRMSRVPRPASLDTG